MCDARRSRCIERFSAAESDKEQDESKAAVGGRRTWKKVVFDYFTSKREGAMEFARYHLQDCFSIPGVDE